MNKLVVCFTDVVSNEPVYLFKDKYNRYWLASGKWSLFRVESQHYECWM